MSNRITLEYEFTDALAERVATLQVGPVLPPVPLQKLLPALTVAPLFVVFVIENDVDWRMYLPLVLLTALSMIPLALWGLAGVRRGLAFRRIRDQLLSAFRDLPHRNIVWTFSEDRFEFKSAARTVTAEWRDVAELLLFRGFHGMKLRWGEIVMIPAPVLTPEIADLALRKCGEFEAKILRVKISR
jgi:hypothetical protein